ncbi:HI1506-related protein [Pseudomonas sp. GTC 16482]|uniref:HI1506-related protein n=1 Tax=Pseudomonas sp. GTC 16482 TaxID=1661693 RepID=UPI000761CA2B|nr:HI1506-related protein [Pseudomonas sp. GTC 16482]
MGTVIKAKRDGYRRAGLAHCVAGTFHEDGDLSERQLAMLRGDPNLLVVEGAQEDVLQLDQGNDDLIQELGNTIAGLEHELGQARAGLKSACSDLIAALDRQKAAPGLVVEALKLLEPEDPTQEGIICIKADSLAALIAEHLQPQQKTPEAQDDANRSTLSNAGGDEPPNPAPVPAVAAADGAPAGAVAPDKAAGKRGKAAQKEAD